MFKRNRNKYYSLDRIKKKKALYNLIIGERSNGKTYSALMEGLTKYFEDGSQMAIIRRWAEDIKGRRASGIFRAINENGEITKLSNGEYEGVHYYAGKFYLCIYEEETGKPIFNDKDCVGFTFSLSTGEHDKSTSYPKVKTIIFDEFLTKGTYLVDEFVHFMNVISTIIRLRTDVTIYMLANTVNKYAPYFKEMGLKHIEKMNQGDIDVYKYGDSKLTVAVEYCSPSDVNKANNYYFAFDNPKLNMITSGAWELDIYPHNPMKFKPKDIQFIYFIEFNDSIYQCEIILIDDITYTFIHDKTTPLKNPEEDLIYTLEYKPKMNYNRNIYKPMNNIKKRVLWYFNSDRVYYQDNEVGNAINNYLKICRSV